MDNARHALTENKLIGLTQTNVFGEIFFSNLNGTTFNKEDSTSLFKQKFTTLLFKPSKLYVVIGTDSGLLPRYIQSEGVPEGTRYLFIEPHMVLTELQETGVLSGFSDYFAFADELSWLDVLESFQIKNYFYIDGVYPTTAFCAQENGSDLYAELTWDIVERLKQLQYHNSISLVAQPFIIQQILNLADNRYPAQLLKNSFKGKTAFILGGGTSLDEVLPWLVEHRSLIIIIAVSRVAKRLLNYNIEPDFICSVDPHSANWAVSKEMFLFKILASSLSNG